MSSNLDRIEKDLNELLDTGAGLLTDLFNKQENNDTRKSKKRPKSSDTPTPISFKVNYEKWYSQALEVIRQLLPNRIDDFQSLYKAEKRKNITFETYTISDYLIGMIVTRGIHKEEVFDSLRVCYEKFQRQYLILHSAQKRFSSTLFDIKQIVQADLLDSEIEAARELKRKGFFRAAGAVTGVVLEGHLSQVCVNHNIVIKKKDPGISDFNDALKRNDVIETPGWRKIQHLGDLRNLCDHNKVRDPKPEEVEELIDGAEKTIKTLF